MVFIRRPMFPLKVGRQQSQIDHWLFKDTVLTFDQISAAFPSVWNLVRWCSEIILQPSQVSVFVVYFWSSEGVTWKWHCPSSVEKKAKWLKPSQFPVDGKQSQSFKA